MDNAIENVMDQSFPAVMPIAMAEGGEGEFIPAKVDRRKGVRKTNDPAAPYGYKADGITPRSKPGRRPKPADAVV